MKKLLVVLFVSILYFALSKNISAQEGGTFNCSFTPGFGCNPDSASASCIAGYRVDDSACSGITDMGECQGTINIPCVPLPTPPGSTLCYACIANNCTPVNPDNFGACPYPYTSLGLYACRLGCNPGASISPPPGATITPGEPKFSCVNNSCVLDPNGIYTSGIECEALCAFGTNPSQPTSPDVVQCNGVDGFMTAIGCIPVGSSQAFASFFIKWAMGIAGGIALALIGYSGFMIMGSSGNPQKLQAGKELLTSAIMGLILILFGVFALRFIGVDILGLDRYGFGA